MPSLLRLLRSVDSVLKLADSTKSRDFFYFKLVRELKILFKCTEVYISEFVGSENNIYICNDLICRKRKSIITDRTSYYEKPKGTKLKIYIPLKKIDSSIYTLTLIDKTKSFCKADYRTAREYSKIIYNSILYKKSQYALKERIKELSTLYHIGHISYNQKISIDDILNEVARVMPSAMQYSEIASCEIEYMGKQYQSTAYSESENKISSFLTINGVNQGTIRVYYYDKPRPGSHQFLPEELKLLDNVSNFVSLIIESMINSEEKSRMETQIKLADRLATIGFLSSGIAHEINNPLCNILGFAELIARNNDIDRSVRQDVDKIIKSAIFAREIIRKLMHFAKQVPQNNSMVNLNELIEEHIDLFRHRCENASIGLDIRLSQSIPKILADRSQLVQVLTNLVVNSIQAMPDGGILTIETNETGDSVSFSVRDTGVGMSDAVKKQIFLPFFTTKDVNMGTGLGLPVVHGIVTSHGGKIAVESTIGNGAIFIVSLPKNYIIKGGPHA